ncbi:hydrogenase maturation hupD domain protein [Mycobacterium kansasii]|uniref:Hydrogenase maturation hupD domain protein n=1 Tax=Mycobacterium kansasii TaxID=1768 RepID=A0A1V3XY23_MYCKA|nr:hydrogenase maturation hupD domain protein [Mycobacterium kansasii]OOK83940.1 hydrogenase maturation hupD domain protein [Mycobacterium kansasii]
MIGLEDVQGARIAAAGHRVDQHQGVPALEQVVGQMHAADAVVDDADLRTVLRNRGVAQHLGAETVVPQENVADSGDQDARCHGLTRARLHPPQLQVAAGIR